jgi:hypothetical protein
MDRDQPVKGLPEMMRGLRMRATGLLGSAPGNIHAREIGGIIISGTRHDGHWAGGTRRSNAQREANDEAPQPRHWLRLVRQRLKNDQTAPLSCGQGQSRALESEYEAASGLPSLPTSSPRKAHWDAPSEIPPRAALKFDNQDACCRSPIPPLIGARSRKRPPC